MLVINWVLELLYWGFWVLTDIVEPVSLALRISANFAADILTAIDPDKSSKIDGESMEIVGFEAKLDPRVREPPLWYKLLDVIKEVLKSTIFSSEIALKVSTPLEVRTIEEERLSKLGSLKKEILLLLKNS